MLSDTRSAAGGIPAATASADVWTVGIEEEFQILDPITGELRPGATSIVPHAGAAPGEVQTELYQSMIETATPICWSLAEARTELRRLRRLIAEAAEAGGARLAAAGTHPFSHWEDQEITPKDRYHRTALHFQQLGRELLIYGCHVHIGVADRDLAIEVLNRARVWLGPLIALAANSPFWLGRDTGYASFRTQIWSRFPMSGAPGFFPSRADYEDLVAALVGARVIRDPTRIYWDLRIPVNKPTVEFRATDVCMTVDEAVMIAGLCRALVRSCVEAARRGIPPPRARHELLRSAHWQAARWGMDGELIDVLEQRAAPAPAVVTNLLESVRPALEELGDWDEVSGLVYQTIRRGTGARRQREIFRRTGRLEDVVNYVVAETARG